MSEDYLFNNFENSNSKENNEEKKEILRKKRFKGYSPDEHTFLHLEPEKMFPAGTYERFIVDTVNELKLEKFECSNEDDLGGNEEYNPKSILGVLFYGYTNGVFHSRKLENLCRHDIRYIFVSGQTTPEHSTISRFIIKYSKEIKELFAQILYIAIKSKYVSYNMIVTDGTKIKANAGKKFSGTIEDFKKKKKNLEKKILEAINKQKAEDKKDELEYWGKKEERYKNEKEKISSFLEEAKEIYTKSDKEVKQNITDEDSRVMKGNDGGYIQGYNAQVSVCEENGIIVTSAVSNNAFDYEQFKPMVEKTIGTAPEEKKEDVKKGKWINDNGYYSAENVKYSHENNLDAYISDKQDKNIYLDELNNDTEIELNNGCKKRGEYLFCYGNKKLTLKNERIVHNEKNYIYGVENVKGCEKCDRYNECIGKNKNKEFWIKGIILENIDKIAKMKNKLRTEKGKMIYSRRMPTVEKVFGYIKGVLNFNRFSLRKLEIVEVQWHIICSMYNLRRIFSLKHEN